MRADAEASVRDASSPNRKYTHGIGHVPGTGDEDDSGVARGVEPVNVPFMCRHRRCGPGGRVIGDMVDDPGECRCLYVVAAPYQPTHRVSYHRVL